jgi:hypothetical protein
MSLRLAVASYIYIIIIIIINCNWAVARWQWLLIGEKISKKDTAFRKVIAVLEMSALSLRHFDKFYDTFLSPHHFTIAKTRNKPHSTTHSHQSSRQKHQE